MRGKRDMSGIRGMRGHWELKAHPVNIRRAIRPSQARQCDSVSGPSRCWCHLQVELIVGIVSIPFLRLGRDKCSIFHIWYFLSLYNWTKSLLCTRNTRIEKCKNSWHSSHSPTYKVSEGGALLHSSGLDQEQEWGEGNDSHLLNWISYIDDDEGSAGGALLLESPEEGGGTISQSPSVLAGQTVRRQATTTVAGM